jgi:hypothetical protein
MEVIENQVLSGKTFTIDEKNFVNCHYDHCTLLYSGGETLMRDSRFDECPIQFTGPASRTVNLLMGFGILKPGMLPGPPKPPDRRTN